MKTPRLLVGILALAAFAFTTHAADKAPALPIEGALKIAQEYLKGKPEPRAIVALTLEHVTLRGETYWFAKWASPILGGERPELGLRIDMHGEITKVVSGGAAAVAAGKQRVGARNIR